MNTPALFEKLLVEKPIAPTPNQLSIPQTLIYDIKQNDPLTYQIIEYLLAGKKIPNELIEKYRSNTPKIPPLPVVPKYRKINPDNQFLIRQGFVDEDDLQISEEDLKPKHWFELAEQYMFHYMDTTNEKIKLFSAGQLKRKIIKNMSKGKEVYLGTYENSMEHENDHYRSPVSQIEKCITKKIIIPRMFLRDYNAYINNQQHCSAVPTKWFLRMGYNSNSKQIFIDQCGKYYLVIVYPSYATYYLSNEHPFPTFGNLSKDDPSYNVSCINVDLKTGRVTPVVEGLENDEVSTFYLQEQLIIDESLEQRKMELFELFQNPIFRFIN